MSRFTLSVALATFAICAAGGAQSPSAVYRVAEEHVPHDVTPYVALDVDLDGDADLVAREGVLRNDGTGRFTPGSVPPALTPLLVAAAPWQAVCAADLDGDGFDDLVLTSFSGGALAVFAFRSTNTGLVQTTIAFPPATPTAYAAFDYDADGFDDLVVVTGQGTSAIWRNQGGAAFVPAIVSGPAAAGVVAPPVVGDFDGDGDLDAFVVDQSAGQGRFLLQSSGAFAAVVTPLPGTQPLTTWIVAGDFDANGAQDVAVSCVLFGVSGPVFVPAFVGLRCPAGVPSATSTPPPWSGSALFDAAAAVDLDGDATPEIVVSSAATATVPESLTAYAGVPGAPASPSAPKYSYGGGLVLRLAFDADGDGDRDLLCSRGGTTPRIVYNDGAGGLYEARCDLSFALSTPSGPPIDADVAVGDFDGDGDVDVARRVSSLCGPSPFAALWNDGHGRFPAATLPPGCPLTPPAKSLAADFDGDGRDDVFRMWRQTAVNAVASLHLALPGGGFANTTVAVESGVATDFVVADLDQDGDPDVAACLSGPNLLVRYVNQGGGVFWRFALALAAAPSEVRVADMNADGAVDFVVATATGVVRVDGATSAAPSVVPVVGSARVEIGDLDLDGAPDLVVDGVPWLQTGPVFTPLPALPGFPQPGATPGGFGYAWPPLGAGPPPANPGPALPQALFDADDDGYLDVLAYGALWRGGPGTAFAGPEAVPFPTMSIAQIPETGFLPFYRRGDFDRDGDTDLLDPFGRLVSNVSRQLSRGRPAAAGRTGSLVVGGPSFGTVELFASTAAFAQNPLAVPGYGNVFLVPAAAVYVATITLPADGVFEASFAVPAAPGLVGLDLYWQAVLPVAAKITNVERTTILSL